MSMFNKNDLLNGKDKKKCQCGKGNCGGKVSPVPFIGIPVMSIKQLNIQDVSNCCGGNCSCKDRSKNLSLMA